LRRITAILLLGILGSPLVVPATSGDRRLKLPACCRPDGRHRCSMMDRAERAGSASGPVARPSQAKCPLFPTGDAIPSHAQGSLPRPAVAIGAALAAGIALASPARVRVFSGESHTHLVRGPPSLSL
jgi:hypothetical protein